MTKENKSLIAYYFLYKQNYIGFGNIIMTQNSRKLYINEETIKQWRVEIKECLKKENVNLKVDKIVIMNVIKMNNDK